MPVNIVLHQPEIPYNTGNIGRTCVAVGAALHLIRPLGFFTDDKALKKAGMDYWHEIDLYYYDSFEDFLSGTDSPRIVLATTKAKRTHTDIEYGENPFIIFGKESAGLPKEIRDAYPESCVRIPMLKDKRSLNLSNSVAVVLYEALRQQRFHNLL